MIKIVLVKKQKVIRLIKGDKTLLVKTSPITEIQ